jgi:hypothetical protein
VLRVRLSGVEHRACNVDREHVLRYLVLSIGPATLIENMF